MRDLERARRCQGGRAEVVPSSFGRCAAAPLRCTGGSAPRTTPGRAEAMSRASQQEFPNSRCRSRWSARCAAASEPIGTYVRRALEPPAEAGGWKDAKPPAEADSASSSKLKPRLDRIVRVMPPAQKRGKQNSVDIRLDATFSFSPSISSAASEGGFASFQPPALAGGSEALRTQVHSGLGNSPRSEALRTQFHYGPGNSPRSEALRTQIHAVLGNSRRRLDWPGGGTGGGAPCTAEPRSGGAPQKRRPPGVRRPRASSTRSCGTCVHASPVMISIFCSEPS